MKRPNQMLKNARLRLWQCWGLLFAVFACGMNVQAQVQTPTQITENIETPISRPRPPAKQGYSKAISAAILEDDVRLLLDGVLRLYNEPGLFTHRQKLMDTLGVKNTQRSWGSKENMSPEGRLWYVDTFAKEGLFANPAWKGRYMYNPPRLNKETQMVTWGNSVIIEISSAIACVDSRAVEGYLDLTLKQSLFGRPHPVRINPYWHEDPYAYPSAAALSMSTPSIYIKISHGCLVGLSLGKSFLFKEISDEDVYR